MTATVKKIKIPFDEYMNLLDTARIAGTIPLGRCMGGRTIPIDEECPHCGSNQGKTLCFLPAKRRDQQWTNHITGNRKVEDSNADARQP